MAFRYPDWSNPDVSRHPYSHYQSILSHQPFGFDPTTKTWICAAYADCLSLLKDPRLSVQRTAGYRALAAQLPDSKQMIDSIEHWIGFVDGSMHALLRSIVLKATSQYMQKHARYGVSHILTEISQSVEGLNSIDIVSTLAQPLPLRVILNLLGIPLEDANFLRLKSSQLAYFFERSGDPSLVLAAAAAFAELDEYLRPLIELRAKQPADDLISHLLAAQVEDPRLTTDIIIGNLLFVLGAGHETTANLIASSMGLILSQPDLPARLRGQPTLISAAVEETLRLEPPVQRVGRLVKEAFTWRGHQLQPGQWVVMLLAAANRDPSVYADPDDFIIERASRAHLSFLHGSHYCAGAQLGRLEAVMAIDWFLQNYPDARLTNGSLDFAPNQTFRSLSRLEVSLHSQKTFQQPEVSDQKAEKAASK